jgi:transposase
MGKQVRFIVSKEQRTVLEELARSDERGEADRARAILVTLDGMSSVAISTMLRVRADQVRRWRKWFGRDGAEGLRSKPHKGREPVLADKALPVVKEILAEPVPEGVVWTVARLSEEVARRAQVKVSPSWLRVVMRVKGGFAGRGRGTRSRVGKMWLPSSGRDSG